MEQSIEKNLQKYGIEFIRTNDNLMPHKKYFYAMQTFPDDIVITVDDDCMYSKNLVKMLYKTHKNHPDCIAAVRVHKMTYGKGKNLYSYNNWINNYTFRRKPSYTLMATGVGGVLYPPGSIPQMLLQCNQQLPVQDPLSTAHTLHE